MLSEVRKIIGGLASGINSFSLMRIDLLSVIFFKFIEYTNGTHNLLTQEDDCDEKMHKHQFSLFSNLTALPSIQNYILFHTVSLSMA
jgi:hypothetical protein